MTVLAFIKENYSSSTTDFFFPNECVGSAVLINKASKVKPLWLRRLGTRPETSAREPVDWRREGGIISEPDLKAHRDSCCQLIETYLSGIVSPREPTCCLRYPENLLKWIGAPAKLNTKSKEIIDYGRRSNIAPHQELWDHRSESWWPWCHHRVAIPENCVRSKRPLGCV